MKKKFTFQNKIHKRSVLIYYETKLLLVKSSFFGWVITSTGLGCSGRTKKISTEKRKRRKGISGVTAFIFKPKQFLFPFSFHSLPSTLHAPIPFLDDKSNRLQSEYECTEMGDDDANHQGGGQDVHHE